MGIADGLSGMEIMANLAGSSSGEAEMPVLNIGWLLVDIMVLKLCMLDVSFYAASGVSVDTAKCFHTGKLRNL